MSSKIMNTIELCAQKAVLFTQEQTRFSQELFFTALQGSQNYGLDTERSDIDTVSLMIPNFEQLVLEPECVRTTHTINTPYGISTIKDYRAVFHYFINGAINVYQILYTPYVCVNEKYRKYFDYLRSMADDITENNQCKIIYSTIGMIRSGLSSITKSDREMPLTELGKKFAMSFYYREFLTRFMNGESFGSAMVSNNSEYLKRLKLGQEDSLLYSIDEMLVWADDFLDRYSNLKTSARLRELEEELGILSLEIIGGKDYGNQLPRNC